MVQTRLENPLTDGFVGEMVEMHDDQMAVRIAKVEGSDEEFYIVQVNPWQLWEVKNKKGKTPKELDQRFTSDRRAQQALDLYLTQREVEKAMALADEKIKAAKAKEEYDKMRALEKANDLKVEEINKAKKSKNA